MIPKVSARTIETVSQQAYRDHMTYANDLADKFEELQPAYMDMADEAIEDVLEKSGVELSDDAMKEIHYNMKNVVIYLLHCIYAQEEANSMLSEEHKQEPNGMPWVCRGCGKRIRFCQC
jgi:hypothetical protein